MHSLTEDSFRVAKTPIPVRFAAIMVAKHAGASSGKEALGLLDYLCERYEAPTHRSLYCHQCRHIRAGWITTVRHNSAGAAEVGKAVIVVSNRASNDEQVSYPTAITSLQQAG